MRTAKLIGVVVCWTVIGCGGIEPQSGGWEFKESVTSDQCHVQGAHFGNGGNFGLQNKGDGTFVIDPQDSEAKFDCALDGSDFECPTEVLEQITSPGVEATVLVHVSVEGTFSSSTEASGKRHGTAKCEGPDCAMAEGLLGTKFPCTVDTEFDAAAQ